MRVIISFVAMIMLSLFSFVPLALPVDEDTYVRYAADSIITMHKHKGNPKAMELWIEEMEANYPESMGPEWQAFGAEMSSDKIMRDRIYEKIIEALKVKGFNSRIVDIGGGNKNIEIIE